MCHCTIYFARYSNHTNKVSPRGWREDMPPPMAVRQWRIVLSPTTPSASVHWSKNRGGSTSVHGWVRSPHISGGQRWPSCRHQHAYSLGSCATQQTDGLRYFKNVPYGGGHNDALKSVSISCWNTGCVKCLCYCFIASLITCWYTASQGPFSNMLLDYLLYMLAYL